jgi:predicted RNA-binding Zn-ribbon protein involved in translation (DUF1610 family)
MNGIPVGRGRAASPYLALFRCTRCKTVGSTWIEPRRPPRCGTCYEAGVELLPDDATRIECPKCGNTARLTPKAGHWE